MQKDRFARNASQTLVNVMSDNEKSQRGSNHKVVTASACIATRLLLSSGYASFWPTIKVECREHRRSVQQ